MPLDQESHSYPLPHCDWILDSPCKAGALALFHFGAISDYCQHQVSISTYVTKRRVLTKVGPSMQFLIFSTFSKKSAKKLSKTGVPKMLVSMANVILGSLFLGPSKIKCQTTGRHTTCPPCHFPLAKSDYNLEKKEEKKERTSLFYVHQNA